MLRLTKLRVKSNAIVPLAVFPLALIAIALFVFWIWMLIEALRTPEPVWSAAGQNQLIYVLLMIFLQVIGTLVYYFVARPALKRITG